MDILEKIDNLLKEELDHLVQQDLMGLVHSFSDDPRSNELADRSYPDIKSFVKHALDFIDDNDREDFLTYIRDYSSINAKGWS